MTKIELLPESEASAATQVLYGMLKKELGTVPNVYQVYGHSSAALKANLQLDTILSEGVLTGAEIEIVALTVSEFNGCAYCIAAHTVVGKMQGMTEAQTIDVRKGTYANEKEQALINFTKTLLEKKGKVEPADLEAFFSVGYNNAHMVEVIGQIAKNFFNNYTNHIAGTPVDFPTPQAI